MSETRPAVLVGLEGLLSDLSAVGIGKGGYNREQKFHFRSIDAVLDVLAPLYVKHKLIVRPSVKSRTTETRARKDASKDDLRFVVVEVMYTIESTVDGSSRESGPFFGEAMDSGDKATNKAMSIAYKYFAIQTYSIPLVGNDDPDGDGEEGLSVDEIISIESGLKAATTKDALRGLLEAAMARARDARDSFAHRRFRALAEKLAEKMPAIAMPREKAPPSPQEEPQAPAQGQEEPPRAKGPPPTKGLLSSLRNLAARKGYSEEEVAAMVGEANIEDLDKAQAAEALRKVGESEART